jgi:transposase-like protein
VASTAVVIAVGVKAQTGEREVLVLDMGPSEDGAFWTSFLRSLVARGLSGVRLVTSDSHRGLKSAVAAVLVRASWQRCRVHFMRNASLWSPRQPNRWWGRPSAPSSPSPTRKAPASNGVGSRRVSALVSQDFRS